jgi:periplasmic protein TonB
MMRHHKTRYLPAFDRPWRRLIWVIPLSLCTWALVMAGFARLLGRISPPPAVQPLEVSLADLSHGMSGGSPVSGAGSHGGGAPGAKSAGPSIPTVSTLPVTGKPRGPSIRPPVRALKRPIRTAALKARPKSTAESNIGRIAKATRPIRSLEEEDRENDEAESIAVAHRPPPTLSPAAAAPGVKPVQDSRTSVKDSHIDAAHADAIGGGGGGGGAGNGSGAGARSGSGGQGTGTGGGTGDGSQLYTTVEHPPVPVSRVLPAYPSAARSQGLEGEVVLRAIVDRRGDVEPDIVVVESIPSLDPAAIEALRQWRFEPGRDADNRPVRVVIEVPLRFRLR